MSCPPCLTPVQIGDSALELVDDYTYIYIYIVKMKNFSGSSGAKESGVCGD